MITFTRTRMTVAGVAAIGLALAGCSGDSGSSAARTDLAATSITLEEQWVKAADSGMTAMFGTLRNNSDADLLLTEVSSPASLRVELHEMADGGAGSTVMRRKQGGITVPAGGSYTLEPGADHVMLFDLPAPIKAGTEVPFTFLFGEAGTAEFTAQVRAFAGAKEEYQESNGG
ncbi:copper chaperone PCu(A)C [Rhodococcus daqingensis]|uniref:Copper chaperone PCu(A)C n=1 Tax=Rhodococcus daqingensis TaxID=2479363 RepID=A0ABW2RWE9_9NOCA